MNQTGNAYDNPASNTWARYQAMVKSLLAAVNANQLHGQALIVSNFNPQHWDRRYATLPTPNLLLRSAGGREQGFVGVCLHHDGESLVVVASVTGQSEVWQAVPTADALMATLQTAVGWWQIRQPGIGIVRPDNFKTFGVPPQVRNGSPLFTIWQYPEETVRWLVSHSAGQSVIWLGLLYGVLGARSVPTATVWSVVGFLCLRAILGVVDLYVAGFLVSWVGREWFGGEASPYEARVAIAWGQLPARALGLTYAVFMVLLVLLIKPAPSLALILALPALLLGIWAFVNYYLPCIAEVHGFSSSDACWTSCLAYFIPAGLVMAVVFAVTFFSS